MKLIIPPLAVGYNRGQAQTAGLFSRGWL